MCTVPRANFWLCPGFGGHLSKLLESLLKTEPDNPIRDMDQDSATMVLRCLEEAVVHHEVRAGARSVAFDGRDEDRLAAYNLVTNALRLAKITDDPVASMRQAIELARRLSGQQSGQLNEGDLLFLQKLIEGMDKANLAFSSGPPALD
ncbi:hypothetical protein HY523_01520 [Candidatus Berkelbacteria bacterium]|nr:hypothetical protein [Candidatus Berkelbacteria bacterium]